MHGSEFRRRNSIGIVVHDFGLGGTERIAIRLANRWAGLGARVEIFCGAREGFLTGLPVPDVHVVEADSRIRRRPGSRRELAKAAARHFLECPVDVCFVPGNFHWPVVPALARLPAPVRPLIVAQVSAALDKPQRGRIRQMLFESRMRRLLRGAEGVICMSRLACAQANRILRRDAAMHIPLPALEEEAQELAPVPSGCRTFLAAGRLVPEKGFQLLIEAFARLDDPDARLVIVGSGPEEHRLRRLIGKLQLRGRVEMPGAAPCIRPWLRESRALVFPSQFEGFGAVLVEALAAGREVITTRCTHAVEELGIDRHLGAVVPVGDLQSMVDAMQGMLNRPAPDPARIASAVADYRIGAGARRYLRAFETWSASDVQIQREKEVSFAV